MKSREMTTARLEAFSDGVIAIIITIMVLDLKVPNDAAFHGMMIQWPVYMCYALSFLMVAEYWVNHHMLFHMVKRVSNRILWSNLLLLFCISLIPFFTAFMGENHLGAFATAAYSAWSMVCSMAFCNLLFAISPHIEVGDKDEDRRCFRNAALIKVGVTIVLYAVATAIAFRSVALSLSLNFIVALMYFLPNAWLEKGKK